MCVKAIAKAIAKLCVTPVITIVITINGPDHLSDLKAVDDSIFLSESKCYSIFLHPKAKLRGLAILCAQFGVIQAN